MTQSLKVCHDTDRILGLQLTVKMHRFFYKNEQMLIGKYQLNDYYKKVDRMVADAEPRVMTPIG